LFSPGCTKDDKRIESTDFLLFSPIMVTEKMDGSNVCLENEAVFARTHAGRPRHQSFSALKAMHACIRSRIPAGVQIFGEWLWAQHTISYNRLPAYFMVFGVCDLRKCLWASWAEVEQWADLVGCPTVPVLERNVIVYSDKELQKLVERHALGASHVGETREGVVVRRQCDMPDSMFPHYVAKWVREDHVQTDEHWKDRKPVRNRIEGG
jgi:hypothetical protein